jgi:hypothetical protein
MMGNKTLDTIRKEFGAVLARAGDDPSRWLENRIATAKRHGHGSEVLEATKRMLERGEKKNLARKVRGQAIPDPGLC